MQLLLREALGSGFELSYHCRSVVLVAPCVLFGPPRARQAFFLEAIRKNPRPHRRAV